MGILLGLAPWTVYWTLVGNVPFVAAALVALAIAVATLVVSRIQRAPGRILEFGAVATFVVLTVLTLIADQSFLERWIQPFSNAGIFAAALTSVLVGKPFIRDFAAEGRPKEVIASDYFGNIAVTLTWIWVAAFGGMTLSSSIPPLLRDDAMIRDGRTTLSVICSWVIPFSLFAAAAVLSRILPELMTPPAEEIVRRTTFVAFSEAEIDQLMYLATEHANREVGAGKEAYDIRIGGKGVSLVGDDTRQSWPSTYKVRDRRR